MGLPKKSKKKIKINRALIDRPIWSLATLIAMDQDAWFERTFCCGVTKSWRSPSTSSQCTKSPQSSQLVQIQSENRPNRFVSKKYNKYFDITEWPIENKSDDAKEPDFPREHMRFCNAIEFKGKYYATSLQGSVAVIEELDSGFRITAVGKKRVVPSKSWSRFREYLMRSDGEILLIFFISRKSIDVVEDVEVYRLDIDKLLWVKVEGLGDKTLFVEDDEGGLWVDASKLGCKKNCVYFNHHQGVDKWLVFDMESGHISKAFGIDGEDEEFVMWVRQRLDEIDAWNRLKL